MRTRWRLTIVVYVLCALAVLEGLGWVTYQAVRLGRSEAEARAESGFQESIRLALWRMESELTPILAAESARPYFHYRAFYPAERAYTNMWREILPGEVLVPSPLLETSGPFIRLHFEVSPDGAVTSPQVPIGAMRELASASYVDSEFLVYHEQLLGELSGIVEGPSQEKAAAGRRAGAESQLEDKSAMPESESVRAELRTKAGQAPVDKTIREWDVRRQQAENVQSIGEQYRGGVQQQAAAPAPTREPAEPSADAEVGMSLAMKKEAERKDDLDAAMDLLGASSEGSPAAVTGSLPDEPAPGALTPAWRTNPLSGRPELLIERRLRAGDRESAQGFWMDWPALKQRLLASVGDLLHGADLEPVGFGSSGAAGAAESGRLLASIPAALIPGPTPAVSIAFWTSTNITLLLTWLAVLAAIVAIGVVLRAAMRLSDRRGRFVSAVTHELRTPLTTFCLYTEMLADGIVKDEPARRDYLITLKNESRRLARIVESVLDYARLGRRKAAAAVEPVPAQELLDRAVPSLRARAGLDDLRLDAVSAGLEGVAVRADPQTVERILFNLVDNACKYAAEASERTIHVTAGVDRSRLEVRVRDHGPGVPRGEESRIFQPFHRARRDAEGPKAGLGLGLALARGLAREMGGDLTHSGARGRGAEFILRLPCEPARS